MASFDLDFVRERYQEELRRREQIRASLNLPVGVLGLLSGSFAFLAREFDYDLSDRSDILLYCVLVATILTYGFALLNIVLAFRGTYFVLASTRFQKYVWSYATALIDRSLFFKSRRVKRPLKGFAVRL